MLTDFKLKVSAVFFQSWKTERPVFILAIVTRKLGVLNRGKDKQDRYRQTKQPGGDRTVNGPPSLYNVVEIYTFVYVVFRYFIQRTKHEGMKRWASMDKGLDKNGCNKSA